mgnify:CR=1 FL=1
MVTVLVHTFREAVGRLPHTTRQHGRARTDYIDSASGQPIGRVYHTHRGHQDIQTYRVSRRFVPQAQPVKVVR